MLMMASQVVLQSKSPGSLESKRKMEHLKAFDGKIKAITFSGDTNKEQIKKLGGTMFGYTWNVMGMEREISKLICACPKLGYVHSGYTVPRSELCGALIVSRLLVAVVSALYKLEEYPTRVVMCLDSRCIICALEMRSSKLLPFFQNRLAEINENLDLIAKRYDVEPVQWVQSEQNPADLLTRGTASIKDIGPGSFHQKGPNFISFPRDKWPVSRSFVPVEIPGDEVRSKEISFFAAVRIDICSDNPKIPINIVQIVESMANYSNCLNKVHRIMARAIRGWGCRDMEKVITNPKALTKIAMEPTRSEIDIAKNLLLVHGMVATAQALVEGRLASLLPVRQGKLIVTTGRLGDKSMSRLLGVSHLPILMPNTRVAYLYMNLAHQ